MKGKNKNKKKKYYLIDYFDIFNQNQNTEKEFMKTDIFEKDNKYIIETDIPGILKEDIKINYENGYLTIKIIKKLAADLNTYIRREKFYGELQRTFYIGLKKESDIKANFKNGILEISFPKEDIPKKESKNIIVS